MCRYCGGKLVELIEADKLDESLFEWSGEATIRIYDRENNSVMFEVRNGVGYIRLGDREDMNCIESGDKIKVNFCPMCGVKLL